MKNIEWYCSVDIETDGPIPGQNSMLSFGAAAYSSDGNLLETFTANLKTLPLAVADPSTTEFWNQNKKAFDETRKEIQDPKTAILNFSKWVSKFPGKPVFVAYPATFDFMFVYWYLIHFTGSSPFSFSALDIKSYFMGMSKGNFKNSTKRNMPGKWFPKAKHSHIALEDALEQGELFMNMFRANS